MDGLITAVTSGLSDGLNPPHLAVIGTALLFILFFRRNDRAVVSFLTWFLAAYFLTGFVSRAGIANSLLMTGTWFLASAFFWMLLGAVLASAGLMFAIVWFQEYRKRDTKIVFPAVKQLPFNKMFLFRALAAVIGTGGAAFAFIWPVSVPMGILANEMYLPGLLWGPAGCVLVHEMAGAAVFALLTAAGHLLMRDDVRSRWDQYRSLVMIAAAAVYLASGSGLIGIFIQQLF